MRKTLGIFIALFLLSGCGSEIQSETVEQITLNYWDWENGGVMQQEETITTKNKEILNTFTDAINNADELEEGKIITSKPLLSLSMVLNENEEKNYHLWINTNGEGYIQQLQPDENKTFKLDKGNVEILTMFLNEKENVEIIDRSIEFEK
ncbi:hypothetical protein [Paenisporosarcina sp. TG20]|uniref:hypothetical protein n=1 Tax=Paenisporosarcina sp. TG20 TaxID=1211706 RepID=UPI0002F81304|nr:hypothetical protein [Paenisporosarcina sp. TG20]